MTWTETKGRKPRTGDRPLKVIFANGRESIHSYKASQLRWSITGGDWDVVRVARA